MRPRKLGRLRREPPYKYADALQNAAPAPSYPLNLLDLSDTLQAVCPEGKADIGHTAFWEQTVAAVLARQYRTPVSRLANLPYCQRRARVVGDIVYYGERPVPELLQAVRQAVGNEALVFYHDKHEKRLK